MSIPWIAAFIALQTPTVTVSRTAPMGNGYRLVVTERRVDKLDPTPYFGDSIAIRHRSKTMAETDLQPLVEDWLKDDSLWSKHELVNNLRYFDNPRPGKTQEVKGQVREIVPERGGCLLRVGLVNTGTSFPRINADVILEWRWSAPEKWLALYAFGDNYMPGEATIRLFKYSGAVYLLEDDSVYRLAQDPSKRTVVASLPAGAGQPGQWDGERNWFGAKQIEAHLMVFQPSYHGKDTVFMDLDVRSGKVRPLSRAQVRHFGVVLPTLP